MYPLVHLVLTIKRSVYKMPYTQRGPDVALAIGAAASPAIPVIKYFDAASSVVVGLIGAVGANYWEVSYDYNPNIPEASQSPTWLVPKSGGNDIVGPAATLTAISLSGTVTGAIAMRLKSGTSAVPTTFAANGTLQFCASYPNIGYK